MLTDKDLEITSIIPINETRMYVNYCNEADAIEALPTTNVTIAAQTTALARLVLYEYLEKLGARVLYFDTDSVFYTVKPGEYQPPLGYNLGAMKNELESLGPGSYITEFIAGAPKFYAYKVVDSKKEIHDFCKVKGITLNSSTTTKLNFDSIKKIVLEDTPVHIEYNPILRTRDHDVITKKGQMKICKANHNKRRFIGNDVSWPFGYQNNNNKRPRLSNDLELVEGEPIKKKTALEEKEDDLTLRSQTHDVITKECQAKVCNANPKKRRFVGDDDTSSPLGHNNNNNKRPRLANDLEDR